MTTEETLHHLVDEPPEDQNELARVLADIAARRVKSLKDYKREREL